MFPALERALDVTTKGPLVLPTGYQTSAAIRRSGLVRLTKWLRARNVRNAESLATAAVEAAERQHTAVPGEAAIASMVRALVEEVMPSTRRSRKSTSSSRAGFASTNSLK